MVIEKVVFVNSGHRLGLWWKRTYRPELRLGLGLNCRRFHDRTLSRNKDVQNNMSIESVFELSALKTRRPIGQFTSYDNPCSCSFTKLFNKSSRRPLYDSNVQTRSYYTYRPGIPRGLNSFSLDVDLRESELGLGLLIQELKGRRFSSQTKDFESHDSEEHQDSFSRPSAEEAGDKKPEYLHFHPSCTPETFREIHSSFQVVYDFVNKEEEGIVMKEVEPHLKRLHYEFDHWDDAIHGFRETERSRWGKAALPVISRMREYAFAEEKGQIPQIHILDLAKTGVIKPHVDSIRFCGNIICGLCLLSDGVMRLVHVENKDQVIDIMLPRRALYVMRDGSRYKYTHEVLGEKESFFNTAPVPRDRRVSIICRNNPQE